ncbi:phosphatidylserine decarboxylase [Tistlia consotensis]|uniref:Phosphatidylserine decarboxylase n=1 Tax=Tistlia consotensis USBA 355 TaxID=560819 RepID=A0A1Y6CKT0_9PROT|nr:phosphatidylserine decarboxylase [Tistlia consotensis]SMF73766.1 phosphatidylserine decarboxylase [Tistlia consotensis USBA 355]SNS28732.1 phosphatidylserine decarboxylase [Tistlia consotensis]
MSGTRIVARLGRFAGAGALAGLLLAGGLPGTPKAGAAELPKYETAVAAELRSLVPAADYAARLESLTALAHPFDPALALPPETLARVAASPCGASIAKLIEATYRDPRSYAALTLVAAGLTPPPRHYGARSPWLGAKSADALLGRMVGYFLDWCTFLPRISGNQDNGLAYIEGVAWLYYRNKAGQDYVQGRDPADPGRPLDTGLAFTRDFSIERGRFMDDPASTKYVAEWIADPRIEIGDYPLQKASDYKSWNAFFAREITIDEKTRTIPSRPATMPLSRYPERDYIVVAPTDCIMNPLVQVLEKDGKERRRFLDNPLQRDLVLDVKGIPVSVESLLGSTPEALKKPFEGGSGVACVLMPNTYHHFHAPVNGTVRHAEIVKRGTYGYLDWPNWVPPSGNVGQPGTDFSQFQQFQRGVVIIEVHYKGAEGREKTGFVASIPVGLNTIGSVVLDPDIKPGKEVKRGYTRIGNFYYGGSLDILLFSKGLVSAAIQTRLGNQIAIFNNGTTPPVRPGGASD